MDPLTALNPEQREAVLHIDGPLLILAGAGSGKTRVIAQRIAYLISEGYAQPDVSIRPSGSILLIFRLGAGYIRRRRHFIDCIAMTAP